MTPEKIIENINNRKNTKCICPDCNVFGSATWK